VPHAGKCETPTRKSLIFSGIGREQRLCGESGANIRKASVYENSYGSGLRVWKLGVACNTNKGSGVGVWAYRRVGVKISRKFANRRACGCGFAALCSPVQISFVSIVSFCSDFLRAFCESVRDKRVGSNPPFLTLYLLALQATPPSKGLALFEVSPGTQDTAERVPTLVSFEDDEDGFGKCACVYEFSYGGRWCGFEGRRGRL
jgi:hypothetical protein